MQWESFLPFKHMQKWHCVSTSNKQTIKHSNSRLFLGFPNQTWVLIKARYGARGGRSLATLARLAPSSAPSALRPLIFYYILCWVWAVRGGGQCIHYILISLLTIYPHYKSTYAYIQFNTLHYTLLTILYMKYECHEPPCNTTVSISVNGSNG